MRFLDDLSVGRKFTAITIGSAGAALFLACTAFVANDVLSFRAEMVRRVSTQAQLVGSHSTSALVFKDPESATTTLEALRADPHVVFAGLYTPDAQLFASYARDGKPGAVSPRPVPGQSEGHLFREGHLLLWRPIELDGGLVGTVVIESDLSEMTARLLRYGLIVLCVLFASFVAAHWTASRLQRLITKPVLHLVETAQTVSAGRDYSIRATPHGRDEIGVLIDAFNEMLGQIQERDAALQKARDNLELQVERRTRDLKREIGERTLLEEQLRRKNAELEEQSRRVQEATRLKSEFLANMSHELRTPLNGIIGFAELMHDAKIGPVSAQHKECLADILTSSRHLLQLINDILDLSKVEAGKMEFRPEVVDLSRLVGEVRDILRTISAKKRIKVATDIEAGLGDVLLDPGKLKQVLYNYLSNALKFTPEEGRVVVRVASEDAEHFRLEVEDSGIGIRAEDMPRLFAEFQQLDASAAKAYPGTGLGLALTKRIVEAQGGRIGVRSTFGRGSIFFAILPRSADRSQAEEGTKAPIVAQPSSTPTILVIEDDDRERAWLAETLRSAGYGVELAATGEEALVRCRERSFDGITLDMLLSDMGGWDVLRELRSSGPNQTTPTIVVTVIQEKGAVAGFAIHDYLLKPVDSERLLGSLGRAGIRPAEGQPILVVDDDPQARKLMQTTLVSLGYRPLVAGSAEEGLRVGAAEKPVAVILDLLMPGMDGFEFLERFRRIPTGRATPVIVWTAKDVTSAEYSLLAASAHAVMLKSEGGTASLIQELRSCVASAGAKAHGTAAPSATIAPVWDGVKRVPEDGR